MKDILMMWLPQPQIRAKATSSWDYTLVQKRLALLAGKTDQDSVREINYLEELLARNGWQDGASAGTHDN